MANKNLNKIRATFKNNNLLITSIVNLLKYFLSPKLTHEGLAAGEADAKALYANQR